MEFFLFFSSLLILVPYVAHALSFQFPGSNSLNAYGDAKLSSSEIQLTRIENGRGGNFSVGRVIYKDPIQIWDTRSGVLTNITTQFTFAIKPSEKCLGDGMAFFLAPNGSQILLNSQGKNIGLFNDTTASSTSNQIVAVEFDTYKNSNIDPEVPHVGIDVGSITSAKHTNMTVHLRENVNISASITYDGVRQLLSVRLSYSNNKSVVDDVSHKVDLKENLPQWVNIGFSASTGSCVEMHTVFSWNFSSSSDLTMGGKNVSPSPPPISSNKTPERNEKNKKNLGLVAGLAAGAVILTCGCCLLWFVMRKRKAQEGERDAVYDGTFNIDDDFEKVTGPKRFSYKELALATNNFSAERKLGQGGFGGVYKGVLDGGEIAVKRISRESKQGIKEYVSEIKIISQLRHKNLVQLLGWCHERGELLLVYELMHNGSLDFHLFGKSINSPLPWEVRYNIASGLASALIYLHEDWEQCVVHRDIKSSNVMLDSDFNAKLGDFGLARLSKHNANMQTTRLAGTIGYMSPEYISSGKASKKSDVYSFGIVSLEIACGRKATDTLEESTEIGLVEWVWDLYGNRKLLEAVDPKLGHEFNPDEVECLIIVGLWCAHPDYSSRPSMKTVKDVLHMDSSLPILPCRMPVPMFYGPSQNMEGLNSSTNGRLASNFVSTAMVASSSTTISTTSGSSTMSLLEAR